MAALRFACWASFCILLFSGCQSTYQQINTDKSASRPTLKNDSTVYVSIPPDGWFNEVMAFDSGKLTAVAVRDAFAGYVKRAYLGRRVETFEQGLTTARTNRCTYLIYPTVLRWEDRATEFTGRRDRIEIKVQVVEAQSGEVLDSTVLKARSRWLTDGGDVPQDLLPEPLKKYAASLFQPIYVPSALQ